MGWALLAGDPAFRRYWLGRLSSYAGDHIARTALLIAVFDHHGGAAMGILLLVSTAPRLLGPLLGSLADRYDQRRLMVGCDLAQAAIYITLACWRPSLAVLLALTGLGTGFATLFSPAGRSLLPRLVGTDRVGSANAALAVAMNTGIAAGPAVGGLLLAGAGLTVTLLVNAATFVVSAALLAAPGCRSLTPGASTVGIPSSDDDASIGGTLRTGLATVWANPVVRTVCLMLLFGVVFAALSNVAIVPLARGTLHASDALVGALGTGYGAGMVAAPLLLTVRGRFRAERVLLVALIGFGVGTVLTGLAPLLMVALVAQVLAGAGNGWQNVANDTLIQQHVPVNRLGTVFGTVYTFPYAAEVLAYAAGAPLLTLVGARWLLGIAGVGVLASLLIGYPLLATALRPRTLPQRVPA